MDSDNALTAEQILVVAVALHARGKHAEAEPLYRAALAQSPENFAALLAVGALCLGRDAPEEAREMLARAVKANPGSAEAHNDFGIALATLGQFSQALPEYEAATGLAPEFAQAHANLANALAALGRNDEAVARFRTALSLAPDRADTHNDLGVVLAALERNADAVRHFERALALKPEFAEAHTNLANALSALDRHGQAVAHFRTALAMHPEMVAAHCGLGYSLFMSDRPQDAHRSYTQALALDPASAEAHRGLGLVNQAMGHLDTARTHFERAVTLAPGLPAFHRALAESKRFVPGDAQLATMEDLAATMPRLTDAQQTELHFALAKAYRDLGEHARAMPHLLAGNALKRRHENYDEAATLTMLRHIETVFTRDLLKRSEGQGHKSDVPVFIVGMPRSGSTLVEQILASHPQVFGAGELHHLANMAKAFRGADVRAFFPEVAAHLTPEQLDRFGARYIELLRRRAPAASRITDKMPANFRFIGLIRMALPNARIIHTVRDPLDTCMSCFSKLFGGSQPFAYDLGELGRYYRGYQGLMAHWRAVLPPDVMLEVRYEDLVGDFEAQTRRIVAYAGLPWDPRTLEFHKTERSIRTASVSQVRQPIFRTAIGRWKDYETMLKPLLHELRIG